MCELREKMRELGNDSTCTECKREISIPCNEAIIRNRFNEKLADMIIENRKDNFGYNFDDGTRMIRSRPAYYKGNKLNGYKMYEGQTDTIGYANPIVRMYKNYLYGTGHYNIVLECPIFV